MGEPLIERLKTEVYFTDVDGVEWVVIEARRRYDGKLWTQYPGIEDAEIRYFTRYTPPDGANLRRPLEVRRYRFSSGESRWYDAQRWQVQLRLAETVNLKK